jgi:glucose-6-phosphate 1-dehydrogenase
VERIVIFAARYLMPALAKLYEVDKLPPGIKITGVDWQEWDDEHGFRRLVLDNLEHHAGNVSADARATMAVEVLEYRQADVTDAESVISALEPLTEPIVAYLALPLAVFAPTIEALKKPTCRRGAGSPSRSPSG